MYEGRLSQAEFAKSEQKRRLLWTVEVGAILKEQRESKAMKQQELMLMTAIDQGTISLFERGQADLSFSKVKALLNAVGLDIAIVDLA